MNPILPRRKYVEFTPSLLIQLDFEHSAWGQYFVDDLACFDTPDNDLVVIRPWHQLLRILADCDRIHRIAVPNERPLQNGCLEIEHPYPAVFPCSEYLLATLGKLGVQHPLVVVVVPGDLPARVLVPEDGERVRGAGEDLLVVGAELHGVDGVGVADVFFKEQAGGEVVELPDGLLCIVGGGGCKFVVFAQSQGVDNAWQFCCSDAVTTS